MSNLPPYVSRRHASEKCVADTLLGDFDPINSRGFQILQNIVGEIEYEQMSRNMLLSLTSIISYLIHVPFPRNFSRRKALIIKWFDMHADQINILKDNLSVQFKDEKK